VITISLHRTFEYMVASLCAGIQIVMDGNEISWGALFANIWLTVSQQLLFPVTMAFEVA